MRRRRQEATMGRPDDVTTVGSKYQIVIPKAIRKKLNWKPGYKGYFELLDETTLRLTCHWDVEANRGSLRGLLVPSPAEETGDQGGSGPLNEDTHP